MDGDAAALVLLSLGGDDGQDTVVEGGSDALGVDAAGEGEGPGELAEAALRYPELVLGGLGRRTGLGLLHGFLSSSSSRTLGLLILDGNLVWCDVVWFASLGGLHGDVLGPGGLIAPVFFRGGVGPLDGAAHDDGLVVAELDVDPVLLDAGELAVQLVRRLRLL